MPSSSEFVVFWLGSDGQPRHQSFASDEERPLERAISLCNDLRAQGMRHVCMSSVSVDQVGQMGVTAVEGGRLPNGEVYDWKMRRR